jgi:hypothetical protein
LALQVHENKLKQGVFIIDMHRMRFVRFSSNEYLLGTHMQHITHKPSRLKNDRSAGVRGERARERKVFGDARRGLFTRFTGGGSVGAGGGLFAEFSPAASYKSRRYY